MASGSASGVTGPGAAGTAYKLAVAIPVSRRRVIRHEAGKDFMGVRDATGGRQEVA